MTNKLLTPGPLYRPCDTGHFTFATTNDLEDPAEGIGQMRAIDAAHFGIGPPGSGKHYLVRQLLDQRAGGEALGVDDALELLTGIPVGAPDIVRLQTRQGVTNASTTSKL